MVPWEEHRWGGAQLKSQGQFGLCNQTLSLSSSISHLCDFGGIVYFCSLDGFKNFIEFISILGEFLAQIKGDYPSGQVILSCYKVDIGKRIFEQTTLLSSIQDIYLLFKISSNISGQLNRKGILFRESMGRINEQVRGWAFRTFALDQDTEFRWGTCCPQPCFLHPILSWATHFWVVLWLGQMTSLRRRQTVLTKAQSEKYPTPRKWPHRCKRPLKTMLRNCQHFSSFYWWSGLLFLFQEWMPSSLSTFVEMIERCSLMVELCLGHCWPNFVLNVTDKKWRPFPIRATSSITKEQAQKSLQTRENSM